MNTCLKYLAVAFIAFASSSTFAAEYLPVVGLDDGGNAVEFLQEKTKYVSQMKAMTESVNDSVLPSLASKASGWMLRTVSVGLGLGIEVGVGPIVKLKAAPRFRLIYSNSTDPAYP